MRVLVTGSKGFVGRWLTREMQMAGHVVVEQPEVDVTDRYAVGEMLVDVRPDAVAHLAAVAFAPQAALDPAASFAVAVSGTINVFEGARRLRPPPVVLVTGSSEVYGIPSSSSDLPFTEDSPIAPATAYAMSKAAQESIALAYAVRADIPVVVARSFSHTGPGQRPVFVVPAMAQRILAVAQGLAADVPVGNLDVKRDVSDVRDVVVAYRLLLDAALTNGVPRSGLLVNVCSGSAVPIRAIFDELCRVAGVQPPTRVDEDLVRKGDAQEVRGDRSKIGRLVGWQPAIPLSVTLADIWAATAVPAPANAN